VTSAPGPRALRAVLLVACIAGFTANFDLQLVNLALPQLGRAFGVSQSILAWAVAAYVLPYAISILAVGRLADGFGLRRVLATGAALFTIGSVIAAVAPEYPVLLVGRALQGVGGAALMTTALAAISATFSPSARPRAFGIFFAAGALAAVVAPLVGAFLTATLGWRGMFASQIPLGLVVLGGAFAALPAARPGPRGSLDLPGLALATVALGAVNVALLQANEWGWTSPAILVTWAVAGVALVAFVWREQRTPRPAVRLAVLRSRMFVASALVGAAAWFGILSGTIQVAVYLQTVRGLSTTDTALVLLPWPLIAGLVFPRSGAIVTRIGAERVMVASVAFATAAGAAMILFDASTPLPLVALLAAVGGVPIALGVTASTSRALAEFPPSEAGTASGVFNGLRQVGSSLGVAIPAAAFDLAGGGMAGSTAAFASRAVVFAIILGAVVVTLPRRVLAPREASAAVSTVADGGRR
jgi:EmrB/QacA subfamily drug resistance transporter